MIDLRKMEGLPQMVFKVSSKQKHCSHVTLHSEQVTLWDLVEVQEERAKPALRFKGRAVSHTC